MKKYLMDIANDHGIGWIIIMFFVVVFLLMFIPILILDGWKEALIVGFIFACIYTARLLWSTK